MNEPHDLNTQDALNIEVACIQAIRAVGANNLILVSGNFYDNALNWFNPST